MKRNENLPVAKLKVDPRSIRGSEIDRRFRSNDKSPVNDAGYSWKFKLKPGDRQWTVRPHVISAISRPHPRIRGTTIVALRALHARRFLSRRVHSRAPLINGETHTRVHEGTEGCDVRAQPLVSRSSSTNYLEKRVVRFLGLATKTERVVSLLTHTEGPALVRQIWRNFRGILARARQVLSRNKD